MSPLAVITIGIDPEIHLGPLTIAWHGLTIAVGILLGALAAGRWTRQRGLDPDSLFSLTAVLAVAGIVGGRLRLDSPALIADGNHARADAYVSLAVIASAVVVAIRLPVADPLIGLAITVVILRITWQSWATVRGHDHAD